MCCSWQTTVREVLQYVLAHRKFKSSTNTPGGCRFVKCSAAIRGRSGYLLVGALLDLRVAGLQFALQRAHVHLPLVDLLPMRVHLRHQLRVALLQATARRIRALHLRLHFGQLIQQTAVLAGHGPVVERQDEDDHHECNQDQRREPAPSPIRTETNHIYLNNLQDEGENDSYLTPT